MMQPLPIGLEVKDEPNSYQIIKRWFNFTFIFLVFFCVFWDGFLIVFYSMIIKNMLNSPDGISNMNYILLLFPLAHVSTGVGLTYFTIAGFLNSTYITVSNGLINIKHAPVPWFGNKDVNTAEITQLYCEEKMLSTKTGHSYTYNVNVVLKDNKQIILVKGLSEKSQALFIEKNIENKLGIKDEKVSGEVTQ